MTVRPMMTCCEHNIPKPAAPFSVENFEDCLIIVYQCDYCKKKYVVMFRN